MADQELPSATVHDDLTQHRTKENTMAPKNYPSDILEQATATLVACKQINPEVQAGDLTQAALDLAVAEARSCQSQIAILEMQLADLRNKRDERLVHMWDGIKRLRATVKGIYGDDSPQYALIGGTRMSERKRPARRQPV
jgi:hypothetical protein